MGALLAGPRRHQTTPRPRQDRPLKKLIFHWKSVYLEPQGAPNVDMQDIYAKLIDFLIKNIDFSLEKCRFGAKKGVLHYVLRRKRVILRKKYNFELEICVKAEKRTHGTC